MYWSTRTDRFLGPELYQPVLNSLYNRIEFEVLNGLLFYYWGISKVHQLLHIIIETVPYIVIVTHNGVRMGEWSKAHSFVSLLILVIRGLSPGKTI